MATESTSETAILSRIILSEEPGFDAKFARAVLALGFPVRDQARMRKLLEKASEGSLTSADREALDRYERVGHFVSLLRSKARVSLKKTSRSSK